MARNVKILKHFELPAKPGTYARLLCLTGEDKGSAYFIEGNRVVLGRGDQSDIVIKDLKTSREHCEIVQVGSDYVVTDLGSHNGIVINDLKIKQHRLLHGDKIVLGKTVYKFGYVDVKNQAKEILNNAKKNNEEDEANGKKKGISPRVGIAIALFVVAFFVLTDTDKKEELNQGSQDSGEFQEINATIVNQIRNRKIEETSKVQKNMNIMFQQGLREFREGNYFRALEQFNLALSNQPNDALAQFYKRKTVESLDRQIAKYFIRARRDRDALKYRSAGVSYCAIMRFLDSEQGDQRYKDAKKYFEEVSVLQGYQKDEVTCK